MSRDLAETHHPIGDLFPPKADALPPTDSYRLTEEQLGAFEHDGFVAGIQVLNDRQLEALRADLGQLSGKNGRASTLWYEYHSNESSDATTTLFHALGAWRISQAFHDLLWHPAITVPAKQLLGGEVRFWHDQLFCKPAHHGGVVAWHQDYSYWTRTEPMAHLTCWIALDDSRRDNGCVHYIPGSHRWPLLPITGLAGDMSAIEDQLDPQQRKQFQSPAAVELQAGQAVFHHPLIVHGSFENRSDRPRRATVMNLIRDGVRSKAALPLLQGVDPIPAGETLGGRYFPRLT